MTYREAVMSILIDKAVLRLSVFSVYAQRKIQEMSYIRGAHAA